MLDDQRSSGYRYFQYEGTMKIVRYVGLGDLDESRVLTAAVLDCGVGVVLFRAHNPTR